jgi:hypothetical protein
VNAQTKPLLNLTLVSSVLVQRFSVGQIQGHCLAASVDSSAIRLHVLGNDFLIPTASNSAHFSGCAASHIQVVSFLKPHFLQAKSKSLTLCELCMCQASTLNLAVRFFPAKVRF